MSSIFSWACWPYVCLFYFYFLRNSYLSAWPINSNRTIRFLKIVLLLTCGSVFLFWKLTPYQVYGLQIFLPFQGLPFHSVDAFTYCAEHFRLLQSLLSGFAFVACTLRMQSTDVQQGRVTSCWGNERFSLQQMVLGTLGRMNCTPTLHHTHKSTQNGSKTQRLHGLKSDLV